MSDRPHRLLPAKAVRALAHDYTPAKYLSDLLILRGEAETRLTHARAVVAERAERLANLDAEIARVRDGGKP